MYWGHICIYIYTIVGWGVFIFWGRDYAGSVGAYGTMMLVIIQPPIVVSFKEPSVDGEVRDDSNGMPALASQHLGRCSKKHQCHL